MHLLELADELQRRLTDSGRLEWAREECHRIEEASDERDPLSAWERLPRVGQLDPRSRAVARELAAWRERTAAAEDKPVNSVLADPSLVELAKRQPGSIDALGQIRGLHPSTIRRRGTAIMDAIAAGRQAPPIPREEGRGRSEAGDVPADRPGRGAAARAGDGRRPGLRADRVAGRARGDRRRRAPRRGRAPSVRALTGWREELVGADLRDLLGRTQRPVGGR